MRYKSPCQFCEDREVGCHSKCEKYADFLEEVAKQREARLEQFKLNDALFMNAERLARRNGKPFGDKTRR